MLVSDLIGSVPKECQGRHRHHYRTKEDYKELFPHLSETQLEEFYTKLQETYPGTKERQRLIGDYT